MSPLHGELQGLHRIRVGNYRVIIQIASAEGKLIVEFLGPRGDVYK